MNLNREIVITAMEKAVRDAFENTLFLDFDKTEEIKSAGFNKTDQVTYIRIDSPIGGKLYLVIGYDLAFRLLQNLYDEKDQNVLLMLVDEIMAEICNTVTGCFMAEIIPSDIEFNFSLPSCSKIAKEDDIQEINDDTFALKFIYEDKSVYCMYKN